MAHNVSCARAIHRRCVCTGCGGALHGWYGAIELAREPTDEKRKEFRAKTDKEWAVNATKSSEAGRISIDSVVADFIDWLAWNEDVTNRVQVIGDTLAQNVIRKLEDSVEPIELEKFKGDSLHHFWCDLLAAFACAIARFRWWHNQAYEFSVADIFKLRKEDKRPLIEEWLIKFALRTAWEALSHAMPGLSSTHINEMLWAIRIFAILLCPAPEEHRAVAKCCLDPIAGFVDSRLRSAIAWTTKERLIKAELFVARVELPRTFH